MRLTVTVPDDVAEQAKQLAADTDRSVSSLVADALADALAADRRRRAADQIQALIGTAAVSADADEILHQMRHASDREAGELGSAA